ncbi:hypothetical protein SAMN02910327_00031 [Peptostreptococcaceae bacterium pGA-8]|nr:hypothetical protein SAMN02910327_00031 [Peptostreptococcaceae bacterium pGA-8]
MDKIARLKNLMIFTMLPVAFAISYSLLQGLMYLIIESFGDMLYPGILDILDEKSFLLDNLLTFPLFIIYGWIFIKIFANKKAIDDERLDDEAVENTAMEGGPKKMKLSDSFMPLSIGKCLIIALGAQGISSIWFIFVEHVLLKYDFWAESYESFNETWSGVAEGDYVWMIISVVILGPIVEEILFRGIIFHCLSKVSSGWFPIFGSAILFGAFHEEPVQVVYTFLMGIVLGYVYDKTGRFELVVIIHILNNLLSELFSLGDSPLLYNLANYGVIAFCIPMMMILHRIKITRRM